MSESAAPAARHRVDVLDGIRGVAIVLVVLSHGWVVWPSTEINTVPPLRVLFGSGDFAVSVFFVIGAYLAVSSMLRERDRNPAFRFGVFWIRRWVRISAHVYPLVIAVLALTAIDSGMQVYSLTNTRESAWHIVTYTWTGYVADSALSARPDLGHLWYVCTDIWTILLLAFLVYLLGRRRGVLLVALAALVVLVTIWRHHVYVTDGEFQALIRITCRMDPMLWGGMAAVVVPWARRHVTRAPQVGTLAVVALLPLMWANNPTVAYFGWAGLLLNVTLFLFVVATAVAEPGVRVRRVLGNRGLRLLGQYSLPIYLWHYPIFWYLSRNTLQWDWQVRTVVGVLTTLVVALLTQRLIERPLRAWLSHDFWQRAASAGLLAMAADALRAGRRSLTSGWLETSPADAAAVADPDESAPALAEPGTPESGTPEAGSTSSATHDGPAADLETVPGERKD